MPKYRALGNTTVDRLHVGVHTVDLNCLISFEQAISKPSQFIINNAT